jgi:ATP adenylyltransferase
MDQLFTPWRQAYITAAKAPGCVFCNAVDLTDEDALIIHRGETAFVILNRFPYTNGHLMIVPYLHVDTLELLDPHGRSEMIELMSKSMHILRSIYNPQGFNLGGNIGSAAGAGVAEHVHLHVLPRWSGDTNFMTAVGNTRILPETLEDTWGKLRSAWK